MRSCSKQDRQAAAFKSSITADIVHRIELECSCTVSWQEVGDDYEGEYKARGFRAWANRDDEFRPGCSKTVATSMGDSAIEALDDLARKLGFDPEEEEADEEGRRAA